jgi:hypothetical protein
MTRRLAWHAVVAASSAVALFAGAPISVHGAPPDQKWTMNGATACETYLTPDVMAAIVAAPASRAVKDDATSCHSGSIYISLKVANVAKFKQQLPRVAMANPMTGVGDAAYWNQAGAVSAVKAPDRGCDVSVMGAAYTARIKDEALGLKLGEICNKLFDLH